MSDRWPGGIISGTAPVPTGGGAQDTAPGIWTIEQAAPYIANQTWPGTGTPDPQFQYVTALLHGDGTNAGQNNTFIDSSANNFTITRNGNTTQGSFNPYGNLWSTLADATSGSNFFSIPKSSVSTASGSTTWTSECWVNRQNPGSATYQCIMSGDNDRMGIIFEVSPNTLWLTDNTSSTRRITLNSASSYIPIGSWVHIAVTNNNGSMTLWINGFAVATDSCSSGSGSGGTYQFNGRGDMNSIGYMSDYRLSNVVRYTSSFTPNTAPFVADANTYFLAFSSNRFIDRSSSNVTITVNGTPSVQRFSPFQNLATYTTTSSGGSGYFDGTGDYLVTPNNAAFAYGTGDFTWEMWIYPTASNWTSGNFYFLDHGSNQGTFQYVGNVFRYSNPFIAGSGPLYNNGGPITPNTWNHVAVARESGTTRLYKNGVLMASATDTYNFGNNSVYVGEHGSTGYPYLGYMSNVRILKGTALYTGSTYTIPTAPFTAITNTSLLLNFTNAAIFDSDASNDFETVGNAQISTSVVKYGTGSMYFDGNGDGLSFPPVSLGGGNLTVEWWANQSGFFPYLSSDGVYAGEIFAGNTTGALGIFMYSGSASGPATNIWVYIFGVGTIFQPAISISLNQWNHFALTRTGGTWRLFVNGNQVATSTSNGTYNLVNNRTIGWRNQNNFFDWFLGYIDDFRVTTGYSRYWYNFQPPTRAFPNYGGTVIEMEDPLFEYNTLLLNGDGANGGQNNTFVDSSTNNFTITRNGNTTQGSFSPYGNLWSVNLNFGTNSGLTTTFSGSVSSGDFTAEGFFFITQRADNTVLMLGNANLGVIMLQGGGKISSYFPDTGFIVWQDSLVQLNTWLHIVVQRTSGVLSCYLNGSLIGTRSGSSGGWTYSSTSLIGVNGANKGGGYWSNCRISTVARYSGSSITVPTAPYTSDANTTFLICAANRFIDQSGNDRNITVSGTVSIQRFSPFEPSAPYSTSVIGGSGYFDGNGDWLQPANSSNFNLGGSNFTIECFFYPTSNTTMGIWQNYDNTSGTKGSTITLSLRYSETTNAFSLVTSGGGGSNFSSFTTSASYPPNQWYHLATERNGSTITLYVNGVSAGTSSITNSFTARNSVAFGRYDGNSGDPTWYVIGYLTNFRYLVGSAVYTTTFTPPTAPLTAITNTQLLLNFINASIADLAMQNNLETVGNAQISTSVVKYGSGSLYFDGAGDWLTCPASPQWLMTGDWTMECWIYPTSVSGVNVIIDTRNRVNGATSPVMYLNGTSLVIDTGAAAVVTAGTITVNTWQHVAATRSGNLWMLFVNGNLVGSATNTTSYTVAYGCTIGSSRFDEHFDGYIDDLRITRGIARYVQPFTPPTAALPTY